MSDKMTTSHHGLSASIPLRQTGKRIQRRKVVKAFFDWLFAVPALVMYTIFVLYPLALSVYYSFHRWNGIGSMTFVGLDNYVTVFQVPNLLGTISNAFQLVIWFSFVSVGLGLITASVMHRVATGLFGTVARTVLFLPQVIPLVAAGIIWGWLLALPGLVNQFLRAIGLGAMTRA